MTTMADLPSMVELRLRQVEAQQELRTVVGRTRGVTVRHYSSDDKFCQQLYSECMASMNVSLPDGLKEFVEAQVTERGYGTSSEFVRDLIRREQGRAQLRALLVDGMGSGPGSEQDGEYFEQMRESIRSSGVA